VSRTVAGGALGEAHDERHGSGCKHERPRANEQAATPARRAAARGEVERRILPQDRLLEFAQRLAGLDSQLVHEAVARFRIHPQRFRLSPGAVEREHQLPPQPLPQRVSRGQGLELRDQRVVPAEGQLGVDPLLGRHESELFEPFGVGAREVLVGDLRQRLPAPEREGGLE
jgi:hypothetical protein